MGKLGPPTAPPLGRADTSLALAGVRLRGGGEELPQRLDYLNRSESRSSMRSLSAPRKANQLVTNAAKTNNGA